MSTNLLLRNINECHLPTYLEINDLLDKYSSQKVLLRNLMSRGSMLSGNESAVGTDGLCSNLESVTSQTLSALCLSFPHL